MLFNSSTFVVFFAIVYSLFLLVRKRLRIRNAILLVASLVFYGYWNWSLLLLLISCKVINYGFAHYIEASKETAKRKLFLVGCLIFNLSVLGFFKYCNFFIESLVTSLKIFGIEPGWTTLNIVLPMGISFYTFQLMGYVVDVYQRKLPHIRNFFDFVLFVSFFPQLVAGPIERATDLVPQILAVQPLRAEQINAGIFLVIWGFFKKIVVADNLKAIADPVFNNYTQYTGVDLAIAILAFTFQIYGDFSGYTDIARGIAKLMGFELTLNFKLPYFALNPSDFWLRWHISLSTWLRDYLYIPLGGNRYGELNTYRNLFVTMLLGGLWHGAAWNFVIWGAYQGGILVLYRIFDKNPEHQDPWCGKYSYFRVLGKMALMFVLTNIGWVIFRSSSIEQIAYFFTHLGFNVSEETGKFASSLAFFSLPLVGVQIYQYITHDLLILTKLNPVIRVPIYALLVIWISVFGVRESGEFIYFQF